MLLRTLNVCCHGSNCKLCGAPDNRELRGSSCAVMHCKRHTVQSADISVEFYPYRAIDKYSGWIICAVDALPSCMRPYSSCHSHLTTDMLLTVHGADCSCNSRSDTDAAGVYRCVARERQKVKAVHRCRRQLTE